MEIRKDVLAGLLAVLIVAACSPREEPAAPAPAEAGSATTGATKSEAAPAAGAPGAEVTADDEPVPDETAPVSFESELEFIQDVYKIQVHGEGNRKLLVLQARRDGKPVGEPVKTAIDGDVVNAYATDLDGDQSAEILLFCRSRGNGRPGTFTGFAFANDTFAPLALPELDATQAAGYRGADAFSIDGKHVLRKFPVFESEADQATGKTRTITYSLQSGAFAVESTQG